jgi:D-alanine transfer protein
MSTAAEAVDLAAVAASPRVRTSADTTHLVAASIAFAIFLGGLGLTSWYADRQIARNVHALAGSRHRQKVVGLAAQREAYRHADLMPLYGTSEVDRLSLYHARDLFDSEPTGFSVFAVGRPGGLVFTAFESIAALGADVRGKKLVISLSPTMFQLPDSPTLRRRYAGNFFPLQALTLLLSRDLSLGFRQEMARRFLARPDMLERNPVVRQAAAILGGTSPLRWPLYAAFLPLARLELRLLETQDRIMELAHILTSGPPAKTPPVTVPIDWPSLAADGMARYRRQASSNAFGLEDDWWRLNVNWIESQRNASSDDQFVHDVFSSDAWSDLEALLQALKELEADALILSMPFHGPFLDSTGVSRDARREYYAGVRDLAARYGIRSMVLEDHEADPFFFRDLGSHLSPKGWVYYDQIIDAFYHGALR